MYRILLADDEKMVLLSTERTFPFSQYHMNIACRTGDSYEALRYLKENIVDAAFLDIRMPGLSGIEIMQECRRDGIDTEFVIVSGHSDFAYLKSSIQLEAFDYCLKPVQRPEAEALASRLSEVLYRRRLKKDAARLRALFERRDISDFLHRYGFDKGLPELTLVRLSAPAISDLFPLLPAQNAYTFLLSETDALLMVHSAPEQLLTLTEQFTNLPGCRAAYGTVSPVGSHLEKLAGRLDTDILLTSPQNPLIRSAVFETEDVFLKLLNEVRAHYTEELSLQALAAKYNFSYTYCSELFKATTGFNFSKYITKLRMNAAAARLTCSEEAVTAICYKVGYQNYHHFVRMFKDYFGETPTEYRKKRGNTHAPEKDEID